MSNYKILVRHGEIGIKGKNKRFFEDKLAKNIRIALRPVSKAKVYVSDSRIYVDVDGELDKVVGALSKVFGIVSFSVIKVVRGGIEELKEATLEHASRLSFKTFRVNTKRADKLFPIESPEISKLMGEYLLDNIDGITVDLHNPELIIHLEVRVREMYVYTDTYRGPGGLPVGTGGKALSLLSGGIDSPVATYLVAKRGVSIDCVHFHSYPFTSERAKEKVIELANILSRYIGDFRLHVVSLTDIQKSIKDNCPIEQMTILSRRFMMAIAEGIAKETYAKGIITGESIGQVASQTLDSMLVTNEGISIPIFRPLISTDKVDIVDIARKIGTYETSILPYEDCCTVFLPKNPEIHPKLDKILKSESHLDKDQLIKAALESREILDIVYIN